MPPDLTVLVVDLGMPAAERDVPSGVPDLATLHAGIFSVRGFLRPLGVGALDVKFFYEPLEVLAGTLQRGKVLGDEIAEDLRHDVVRDTPEGIVLLHLSEFIEFHVAVVAVTVVLVR